MTLWNIHMWAQEHTYTFVFGYYIHTCRQRSRHIILTQNATCSSKQWQPREREWIILYPGLHTSECVLTVLECEERPGPWWSHAVVYVGIRWMSGVVVNSLPQTHADNSTHIYCTPQLEISFTKPSTTFILQATHAGVRKAHFERAAKTLECGFTLTRNWDMNLFTRILQLKMWNGYMPACSSYVLYWTVHSTFKPISITVNIFIDKLIEASIWWL